MKSYELSLIHMIRIVVHNYVYRTAMMEFREMEFA